MKVISIGTDRKLFEEGSCVLKRAMAYAALTEEFHIIVFTQKGTGSVRRYGNLHIHPTDSFSKLTYVTDAYGVAERIIKERSLSEDTVVTTQDPFETGLVGTWIKSKHAFPLQIQVHTDFLSPYFTTSLLNNLRVRMAKYIIPKADGIRVVSSVIESSIKNTFPRAAHIDVLPIFVDIEKMIHAVPNKDIRKEFPECTHIVLMASRLTSEKRIDIAIQALKKVLEFSPRVCLVIAGSGPLKKDLEFLAQKLGVSSHVRFVGWQDDLISYYKTSDLFLSTSEYEGYGMTLIEAGAAGCPIVTAKVGIAKTDLFIHGVNCSICQPCDESTVADALASLLENAPVRNEYKVRMQEDLKARATSWDSYVHHYVTLLDKLL